MDEIIQLSFLCVKPLSELLQLLRIRILVELLSRRDCVVADQGAQTGALVQLARALENGLKRHQWRLRSELQKAQNRVEVVRADYVIKARDLKTLKNLRDKRREEWRREAMKAEQAELDELARLSRAGSLFGQKLGIEEA